LVLFGFQFSLRESITGGTSEISESLTSGSISPQFGEFAGVGSITLYAIEYINPEMYTYGKHFIIIILNSIPYFKVGDILFPDYVKELQGIRKVIAPWGALTMAAESYLTCSTAGIMLLAIFLGLFLALFHRYFKEILSSMTFSVKDIYWLSFGAIFISKYRSGISDILSTFINFSLLYFFFYQVSKVLRVRKAQGGP